jgi:hypothetical protein
MKITEYLQPIDSLVFRNNVLNLLVTEEDGQSDFNFKIFEKRIFEQYNPCYTYTKISIENVKLIQYFEQHGYEFIEVQIQSKKKIGYNELKDTEYYFKEVDNSDELQAAKQIAMTTFTDDRIYVDPYIPNMASGERYVRYVENSHNSRDECLLCLKSNVSNEVVAFKTHKYVNDKEVLFLLGGVRSDLKNCGIGPLSSWHELNYLYGKGYSYGITNISARNYAVFNLEIGKMNFKVKQVFIVLRKLNKELFQQND